MVSSDLYFFFFFFAMNLKFEGVVFFLDLTTYKRYFLWSRDALLSPTFSIFKIRK